MGTCINHPDRETSYLCMKHNLHLCEDCLECRDPQIFCKFRSSCPIWFLTKRKAGLEPKNEEVGAESIVAVQVTFLPENKTVTVPGGTTLLDAARKADFHINASCNGSGACGKCKLVVTAGETETPDTPLLSDVEKEKGSVWPLMWEPPPSWSTWWI